MSNKNFFETLHEMVQYHFLQIQTLLIPFDWIKPYSHNQKKFSLAKSLMPRSTRNFVFLQILKARIMHRSSGVMVKHINYHARTPGTNPRISPKSSFTSTTPLRSSRTFVFSPLLLRSCSVFLSVYMSVCPSIGYLESFIARRQARKLLFAFLLLYLK